ncbi:glutamyl-tRNA reductase [Carnobacteriaceae bacterium zg-ZUI78]|nr:glutamyl-tRNA reductase [Carnobacteriaceae bacterium zg-ZUI78]
MYLLYVGLTHKNTPIHIREAIHFSDDTLEKALKTLYKEKSILEDCIVSTCNRTELYLVVDQLHTGRYYAKHFLADWFQVDVAELEKYLVMKEADEALRHLLRVSVGLESRILGETQILGQLKKAFEKANVVGTTGIILNNAFRQAVSFAKRMHEQYKINERPTSVSFAAIQLLDALNLETSNKTVALIGLGEIGQLLANYLLERSFKQILFFNRTLEKAEKYNRHEHICICPIDALEKELPRADIVFSAVSTQTYLVHPTMLKEQAIVFDLGVPRTVHPTSKVDLYDIDTLTQKLDSYQEQREQIAHQIVLKIDDELIAFDEWRKNLGIVPLIKQLRENALNAQVSALDSLERKLPHLSEREHKLIQKHMKSIVNQLLKNPILQLKEMSVGDNSEYDIALVAKIFGLDLTQE